MIIGGLQKFSLLDYPGCLSAIVFTQGCNFRCQFCYNPMLVVLNQADELENKMSTLGKEVRKGHPQIPEGDLFDFLQKRIGKLDAVVITGGEPTLHHDLPEFIGRIKNLGFKIKLDTNGTNPEMIKRLIAANLLDYIAMDIKSSPEHYKLATGVDVDMDKIMESIEVLKGGGVAYEFRTTVVPDLVVFDDIEKMGKMIEGADKWYLQQFKPDTDLINHDFQNTQPYTSKVLEEMRVVGGRFVGECGVR